MSKKIINILGKRKRVILTHFNYNKVIMEAISEEIENDIDSKIDNVYKDIYYDYKNNPISKQNIICYGKIDINENDSSDCSSIKDLDESICSQDVFSPNSIPVSFDYDKGTIISEDEIIKVTDTYNTLEWFKYNYTLIGKPERIIIYVTNSLKPDHKFGIAPHANRRIF